MNRLQNKCKQMLQLLCRGNKFEFVVQLSLCYAVTLGPILIKYVIGFVYIANDLSVFK